jgi:hypothetical protein
VNRARIITFIASLLIALIVLPFTAPFQTLDLNGQPDAGTRSAQLSLAADDAGLALWPTVIERWRLTVPSLTARVHASFFAAVVTTAPVDRATTSRVPQPLPLDALRI